MSTSRVRVWVFLGMIGCLVSCKSSDPVERLVRELRDHYTVSREEAARKLGEMGGKAAPAVPALRKALLDISSDVRSHVAQALGKIGPLAKAAIPDLSRRLWDKEEKVRSQAAWALGRMGDDVLPELQKLLRSEYPHARYYALVALSQFGTKGITLLQTALKDPSNKVRRSAVETLLRLGHAYLPLVLPLLRDADEGIRSFVAWQLSRFATRWMQSKDSSKTTQNVDMWIKALESTLKDSSYQVRMYGAFALGKFGPLAIAALDRLQEALQDEEWFVRKHASHAIGTMGSAARKAIPALAQGLLDETWDVKNESALAFRRIDESQAVLALIPLLATPLWQTRQYIVQTLGWMGKKSVPAVSALIPLLRDDVRQVRYAVATSLVSIGSASVPLLIKRLKSPDVRERLLVAETLGQIGGKATSAIPALSLLLGDRSWLVRRTAAVAIGQIRPFSPVQIQQEFALLQAASVPKRRAAAVRLGAAGSGVATVLPQVWALTRSQDPLQREAAWTVLSTTLHHAKVEMVTEIWQRFTQETPENQRWMSLSLAWVDPPSGADTSAYFEQIRISSSQDSQEAAVVNLERWSVQARHLVWLVQFAASRYPSVQQQSLRLLYRQVPSVLANVSAAWVQDHLVRPLLALVPKATPMIRLLVARALGQLGDKAVTAVPALQKMLKDDQPSVRRAAAAALGWIGRQAHPAIPALQTVLQDRDPYIRRNAVFAISRMGKQAISPLVQLLSSSRDSLVLMNVGMAFQRIWIPSQQERRIIESFKILLLDKKLSARVHRTFYAAIKRIESSDKPHIFWVDHPRSPTLDAYTPDILFPQGTEKPQ